MKILIKIILVIFIIQYPCFAKRIHPEKDYQSYWCKLNNGIAEYRLNDSTRIDCLTDLYAIEFDFANKWSESIGQALYYSIATNKKPAIVLIIENPEKDKKFLKRLETVAKCYNIKIWTITPETLDYTSDCISKEKN